MGWILLNEPWQQPQREKSTYLSQRVKGPLGVTLTLCLFSGSPPGCVSKCRLAAGFKHTFVTVGSSHLLNTWWETSRRASLPCLIAGAKAEARGVCVEILLSLASLLFLFLPHIVSLIRFSLCPVSVVFRLSASSGPPAAQGSLVLVTGLLVAELRTKISVSAGRCLSVGLSPACSF